MHTPREEAGAPRELEPRVAVVNTDEVLDERLERPLLRFDEHGALWAILSRSTPGATHVFQPERLPQGLIRAPFAGRVHRVRPGIPSRHVRADWPSAEHRRMTEDRERIVRWRQWGPYLSERAWGTVREDYSASGDAWNYFPHDHARSRAYRWSEDGMAGLCDRNQTLCSRSRSGTSRIPSSRSARSG